MQIIGGGTAAEPSADSDLIKDGSIETFAQDVMQASMQTPVLVDFWAPWCGPCKQLTPTLEKVVKQAKGKVKLVKINIDENPEIAQQLRIQSVPTVYAFVGGQPVTGFAGAQPESQIRQLVEKLAGAVGPGDTEEMLKAAKEALDQGDINGAGGIYGRILEEEPENPEAIGGLARCLLSQGEIAEAKRVLEQAPQQHASHSAISGAKAAISLAEEAGDLGDPATIAGEVERDPDNHEARYRLATSLFLRGQAENAMQQLCEIVKRDRTWNEDAARRQLVRFFEALGPTHPQTIKGRRMLSSVLFA